VPDGFFILNEQQDLYDENNDFISAPFYLNNVKRHFNAMTQAIRQS
jgi:hypothetical protein